MATSGTTAFNMDFTEIAEEAWERAGREMRSGYDLRTARRSMNLLTIEWQNRGINMWTIDSGTINLVKGTATYDLPADTIDLLEQVIRTGSGNVSTQSDLTLSRISVAMKDPELVTRLPILKAAYEEAFELAAGEDREKATISLIPRLFGTN
jgi:hypothetical protein